MSDSGSDRDVSELARAVIDELEPGSVIDDRVILSRRQAVGLATGAISLGALGGFGASSAQAQTGPAGKQGTADEPNDMYAWDLDVANEVTSDLPMGGNDVRDVGSLSTGVLNNGGPLSDGDGTERKIWVIASGASDPAEADPEDIILEEE